MRLGVNIDHVATLRQQRRGYDPDPVFAALTAQAHGADSIVAHLREDRRHIQDRDIRLLKQSLRIPLAMEMGATEEMERIALDVLPGRVCLVPERRQELTTEGGLDVIARRTSLQATVKRLRAKNIEVSLFINPDLDQVKCAKAIGADTIEFHTGRYADAKDDGERNRELAAIVKASEAAARLKLRLHAGHGLDYKNAAAIARIPGMEELNIGFSIISQALTVGLAEAVRQMKTAIQG